MQRQSVRNLPTNKEPTGTRCITLEIPDDDEWEQQAFSELYRLGLWMLWERDLDKSGAPVARRWRRALDTWAHCDGTPTPIDGVEWDDDMAICESLRWHEGVLQGYCCGEWVDIPTDGVAPIPGSGGQPGSGSRPGPGASTCFNVTLPATGRWLMPMGVQDGDIITITNRDGAWSDGDIFWQCSDGTPFVFGACIGSRVHELDDPDSILYHGQLAIQYGTLFFSGTDGPVTLSGLSGLQQLVLRPNFLPAANASGEVNLKICIENGDAPPVADWTYVMDFTLSDYDWEADGFGANYEPGTGWKAGTYQGAIKFPLPAGAELTYAKVWFDTDGTDHACNGAQQTIGLYKQNSGGGGIVSWFEHPCDIYAAQPPIVESSAFSVAAAKELAVGWYNTSATFFNITRLELHGTGTNPFI